MRRPVSYMLGAMDHAVTAVERAFQLAKSSACTCVKDIKECLTAEGYSANQISGSSEVHDASQHQHEHKGQRHAEKPENDRHRFCSVDYRRCLST